MLIYNKLINLSNSCIGILNGFAIFASVEQLFKKGFMKKYVCNVCGYEYDPAKGDPDNGIAPGTKFEDLPADWVCPLCSVDKTHFEKQ